IFVAIYSLFWDRKRRAEERRERRRALLVALQVETIRIVRGIVADFARFDLQDLDVSPRVPSKAEVAEHQRAFVWTPLQMVMLDDVLREPYLLSITPMQIGNIAALRGLTQIFNGL